MKTIMLAVVLLSGIMLAYSSHARADDCNPAVPRDYGIEALCLFAEDSALAGKWPADPIVGDLTAHYAEAHSADADLLIGTGRMFEYFNPRLARIHDCYTTQKINMCDVYQTR